LIIYIISFLALIAIYVERAADVILNGFVVFLPALLPLAAFAHKNRDVETLEIGGSIEKSLFPLLYISVGFWFLGMAVVAIFGGVIFVTIFEILVFFFAAWIIERF